MSKSPWQFDDLSDDNLLRVYAAATETVARRILLHSARVTPDGYKRAEATLASGNAVAELRVSLSSEGTIGLWLLDLGGTPIASVGEFRARAVTPAPAH